MVEHSIAFVSPVCGHVDLVDVLESEGVDFNAADQHLARPLHYAAQMCGGQGETADPKLGLKLLNKLLSKNNIDLNATDQVRVHK